MGNETLLAELFDKKLLKVLSLMFGQKTKEFYLQEIADQTKVPIASTYRIMLKLAKLGIVELVHVSRFKLYKIVMDERTRQLENILVGRKTPLEAFIEQIKELPEVEEIILHGDETRDGANIVVIGDAIEADKVNFASNKIREDYNYTITSLPLTRAQFDQMNTMNLFPKRKKTLYKNY